MKILIGKAINRLEWLIIIKVWKSVWLYLKYGAGVLIKQL